MREQSEYFRTQIAEVRAEVAKQVMQQQTQSSTVTHMEISSLERKLTNMIEDLKKSMAELPSHHDLNIVGVDTNKKIKDLNSMIE